MIKIIHTADWHIGKILHRQDLNEDLNLFFVWLIEYIKFEKIDLLLVSGDIFDLANPSNRDTTTYYKMLYRLSELKVKVIITGGNHDSISLLDAPSDLLDTLNITVVGGAKNNLEEEIIPFYNANNVLECVVLAVPFLRDKDLRQSLPAGEMPDKSSVIELAIKHHYAELIDLSNKKYGSGVPVIAMGHLFMKGAITSDSERDIHIGNLSGIDRSVIHPDIDYMALGHIHKPQKVSNKENIRYCGSPIFLDFSERDYDKKVILIETDGVKIINIQSVPIPKSRDIVKFAGSLENVTKRLSLYKNTLPLCAFIEIEVLEPIFDIKKIQELEDLREKTISDSFKILKSRISFASTQNSEVSDLIQSKSITELSPLDIFRQKLSEGQLDESLFAELLDVYDELLQELNY